jgi:hypothetical protein
LRESTTCYEFHPLTFLNIFLPPPKKDSYVTRVMQRLRKKKILTGAGWSRLMQQDMVMKEHNIFNKALDKIVNTIIQVLPNCQCKLSSYDISYALMLWLDNCDALNSLGSLPGIFLVADGFQPFMAKCPDVSQSDRALLFLHQAKSRPTKDEPAPSDQPKTPAGQTRYPRKVKMCPIIAVEESQVEKWIHLEDVIACLQFKPKDKVSQMSIAWYQELISMFLSTEGNRPRCKSTRWMCWSCLSLAQSTFRTSIRSCSTA